ncbi:hypothetical protein [Agrococcus versicolor]|uniref:hypothetical protein n=1 Tax=Agrococcus versicolor TaxID=501482 RepID=UPI0031DF6630
MRIEAAGAEESDDDLASGVDGTIVVRAADGMFLAGVAPAWAVDASGRSAVDSASTTSSGSSACAVLIPPIAIKAVATIAMPARRVRIIITLRSRRLSRRSEVDQTSPSGGLTCA